MNLKKIFNFIIKIKVFLINNIKILIKIKDKIKLLKNL